MPSPIALLTLASIVLITATVMRIQQSTIYQTTGLSKHKPNKHLNTAIAVSISVIVISLIILGILEIAD